MVRRNRWELGSLMKKEKLIGNIERHPKGFGFVRHEDGDIFIGKNDMNTAMDGDLVEVDLLPQHLWERNKEGQVHKVIARKSQELVGTLQLSKGYGFVIPSNMKDEDVFIPKKMTSGCKTGDLVVVEILKYPTKNSKAEGRIKERISGKNDGVGIIKAMARAEGMRETFPSKAMAQGKAVSKIPVEIGHRVDLRNSFIVTIDGQYAKDLDDAVSVELLDNGNYLLSVHIADVSNYVERGSALDLEALKRGNSVYLLNTVIPMLPADLSDGACSLNQGEDKLTLTCEMEIDSDGKVVGHNIYESVINSNARLVYDDVSDYLEGKNTEKIETQLGEHAPRILLMEKLSNIIEKRRHHMGSIDFDFDEAEITVDENAIPIDISIAERRIANRLIENFMLMANKTVAQHFFWMELPFVYRVHQRPELSKLMELKTFLSGFGLSLPGNPDNIHPRELNRILEEIKDKPYEKIVATILLRTMQKAYYSVDCNGHFGLAFDHYCHFTSPIRRYPDLFIHRVIKATLRGQLDKEVVEEYRKDALAVAEHTSLTERKAMELERTVEKMKKAEYMEGFIGAKFQGVVSGVTSYGAFVELTNTVEGLIHVNTLPGYYDFEEREHALVNRQNGHKIKLGQPVKVKVIYASGKERIIDFKLLETLEEITLENI